MLNNNITLLKVFNYFIGFSLFAPLAIIYFAKVSGSYTLGTSIFGIIMLSSAVFEVPTGIWSDKVGRRGTIILGSWARVIAFVLYALSNSYTLLVIGAIFEGLSRSFYSGNNDALLHDSLADDGLESDYDMYLGKTNYPEQLSLGISAVLGGIIASLSFQYLMWLSVLSQLGLLFISYRFVEPKSYSKSEVNIYIHLKKAIRLFIANKRLRLLSIGSMLGFAFGENKYQFRSAFVGTIWPIWAIGASSVLSNFGASLSYYFSSQIIKRFSAQNILYFSSIYNKIIMIIATGIPSIISPILLATTSLLHGVRSVSEGKLFHQEFVNDQRATMSSLNSLGGNILFFIVSITLGAMADNWGPATAMLLLTTIELPTIYIYWNLYKKPVKSQLL